MKKAFDQNVSRAKPRVRLGAIFPEPEVGGDESSAEVSTAQIAVETEETVEEVAEVAEVQSPVDYAEPLPAPQEQLVEEVKARSERARAPKLSAAEAIQRALEAKVEA